MFFVLWCIATNMIPGRLGANENMMLYLYTRIAVYTAKSYPVHATFVYATQGSTTV